MSRIRKSDEHEESSQVPQKRQRTTQPRYSSNSEYTLAPEDHNMAGRVESIQMVNFMCHSNLEVTLNPRVNFVSGKNGSGKSAVMAALVVVLGGTANNTGRASGVSDFIKKGENAGRVTIVLINAGINPYKLDIYGDRITIIRNFARSSAGGYIIKSASGAVISRKRDEVDRIRDALQLQIKNPICVLNQDVARNFLTSADSRIRYQLFEEATELKTLIVKYTETAVNLEHAQRELKNKTNLLEESKKEVMELKKKLKFIQSLESHILLKEQLSHELVWAGVINEENALAEIKVEIATLEGKIANIQNAVANHADVLAELEEQIQEQKEEMGRMVERKRAQAEVKQKIYAESMIVEKEVTSLERQISQIEPKLRRTQADMSRVKEYMSQIDESVSRSAAQAALCQARMQEVQGELRELREKIAQAERDLDGANETKARSSEEYKTAVQYAQDLERAKAHKQTQLEGMKGRDDLDILKFGNYTPQILQAIDAADKRHKFKKRPVGPCGLHVKLTCDPKWASCIESHTAGLLQTYCVDNGEDKTDRSEMFPRLPYTYKVRVHQLRAAEDFKVLLAIMESILGNRKPSIIISKFLNGRHNVSARKARAPGYKTIMDCLSFSNDTAFNTFVDHGSIEKVLLFETQFQAQAMLDNVENVPRDCVQGLTITCDRYMPAPNYRTYYGRPKPPRFFDTSKREDVIKKLEGEIRKMDNDMAEQHGLQNTMRKKLEQTQQLALRCQKKMREYRDKRVELETELSELKDQEHSRPVPRTKQALEEELAELRKIEIDCSTKLEEVQRTLDGMQERKQSVQTKLNQANGVIESIQEKIGGIEVMIDRKKEAILTHNARRRNADTLLDNLTPQVDRLREQQAKAEVELERTTEEAIGVCPRIDVTRPAADVQRLLSKEEQYLKEARKISGSPQETVAEYQLKTQRFAYVLKEQDTADDLIKFFLKSLRERRALFMVKRSLMAQTVSHCFQASLMSRGFEGNVSFDFKESRLELEVQPYKDGVDNRKDSKTLSGGERSYSTVSFVLAIWKTVRMPFYFLDEFDVFMDKVNRKTIMDLLLYHADENIGKQYVFITPLDISNIVPSETITIYRMPDPERKRASP